MGMGNDEALAHPDHLVSAEKPTVPTSADIDDQVISLLNPAANVHLLDLGCGWGEVIDRMLPILNDDGYIMGVDRHVRALVSVQHRHWAEIAAGKLELLDHDISHGLSNANQSMDGIICHNSLEGTCGPGKALEGVYRE